MLTKGWHKLSTESLYMMREELFKSIDYADSIGNEANVVRLTDEVWMINAELNDRYIEHRGLTEF